MHETLRRLYECAGIDHAAPRAPTMLARHIGESPQTVTNWASRGVSQDGAIKLQRRFGWSSTYILDGSGAKRHESASSPAPIFNRKQREDDNVTAVRIALRSLAQVLLAKSPGAAAEFLATLEANCESPPFSPDHFLLGSLADIAEAIRDGEEAATAAPRRAGSARRTKRDT